ncbi:small GTPase LIP1-like isoform X1 [Malus sylvestris]|uniref:small GTPase LIP1-like isoform X1 n=1 Tax=Malus sylvestris TaxID=3752 RepID=UPI0021ACADD2|nr:small GTPase LIP1-like isoform X1 [Malus sylvestris]
MFWRDRDRERDSKDQNRGGGPPCGQVRVLVVGDSGVGKTALVYLIVKGSSITRPPQTVGCTVGVKHTTYGNSGSSSSSIKGDAERDFFIELWDVSGHDRYKECRSLFYSQINGVIFVHDLSQRRTKTGLQKWAAEIAATGTFSAPLGSGGPGGLPVPYIVIGNKADIAEEGTRGSSGNLVDVARQWVEKQGLLPSSEELPLTEGFPGAGGLIAAAKEARYDKEAVMKFFRTVCIHALVVSFFFLPTKNIQLLSWLFQLIKRRYFSDDLPAQNPWSSSPVQRPAQTVDENWSDEDHSYRNASLRADPYKYNMLPPLPAQRNLTPPPTLYPQQPVSVSENYGLPRFSHNSYSEISSAARSKRSDINV